MMGQEKLSFHERKQIEKLKQLYSKHDFWDTQPVLTTAKQRGQELKEGEIVHKQIKDISNEPLPLPAGFEWSSIDLADEKQATEVYELLRENYVEDSENTFRFDYPIDFIRWALLVPGYKVDWFVGVRVSKTQKLFAFISGIPIKTRVKDKTVKMAEINFLCVHKKLRTKRLAPVLIKEITRRVNLTNVWQALYTAGVVIPTPITTATYWHRSLNVKKLIDVGFNQLPSGMPMARYQKMQKVPKMSEVYLIGEVRPLVQKDIAQVYKLLVTYLEKYQLKLRFSEQEVSHMLLPRDGVIYSYVVENPEKKQITDFVSFYRLPSSVLKKVGHNHDHINVAYSYYNVNTDNSLLELMRFAIVKAKEVGFDVFNALDIQDNHEFLTELKFSQGDGYLHYYLYNWHLSQDLGSSDVGIVLV
ncbi:n-myristoyl transferase [Stylonychia lemnae]|uniref:Glycylpeptide N-tetradecanoyltransferase n=1 Tax=Stylonychia lemnae TaxID=5949 RepID=A0A077ZQC7_STYLE|nr:n-myristoyl transferase [Stylonychia lemnae]|eukprot:CDW71605.1 n-myristoyl transferase [Stylonychia lemnae]